MESPPVPSEPSLDTLIANGAGYLDTVLSVFERHSHPFVLVSAIATRWCGLNPCPDEIDVLVRSSQMMVIVDDLIASGEWEICSNRGEQFSPHSSYINHSPIKDVWLKSRQYRAPVVADWTLHHLRFWPEELYQLSVECNKLEVPDVDTSAPVLLEKEYYRDPYERFGPESVAKLLKRGRSILRPPRVRAKAKRQDIPMFVPTIEEHLNALLDQLMKEDETTQQIGNAPQHQIRNFIRYLYLDWTPARDWILSCKIRERNRELMAERIGKYQRKLLILYDNVLKQDADDIGSWPLQDIVRLYRPTRSRDYNQFWNARYFYTAILAAYFFLLRLRFFNLPPASNMSSLSPLQQATFSAYAAACAEVPHDLRRGLILFGCAATIAHGVPERKTEDCDILVTAEVLALLGDAIDKQRGGFHRDSDGEVKWNVRNAEGKYEFEIKVEFVLLGGPFNPRTPDVVGFGEGFVVTLPELVRLRAETLVARGDGRDYADLRLLIPVMAQRGLKLPHIGEEELGTMLKAVGMLKDEDVGGMFIDMLSSFEEGGRRWSCWREWAYYFLHS